MLFRALPAAYDYRCVWCEVRGVFHTAHFYLRAVVHQGLPIASVTPAVEPNQLA
jgi:hypothetical protein